VISVADTVASPAAFASFSPSSLCAHKSTTNAHRTKEVFVNGHKVVIRYNDTCHFYQPPRAHHCSVNDNCIERFDHHCPWVGTTIGKVRCSSCLVLCAR
jgi:hypothetical protein